MSVLRNRKLQLLVGLSLIAVLVVLKTQSLNSATGQYFNSKRTINTILRESNISCPKTAYFYERNLTRLKYDEVLLPYTEYSPDTVRMIWCGKKWFEFKHYLSLLSVMKVQQPNKVVIYYWRENLILRDRNDYNLWYQQLTDEYYNIVTVSMGDTAPNCTDNAVMMGILRDVMKNGGVYVNDTVIINRQLHELRSHRLAIGVRDKFAGVEFNNIAFMVASKGAASTIDPSNANKIVTCDESGELFSFIRTVIGRCAKCVWIFSCMYCIYGACYTYVACTCFYGWLFFPLAMLHYVVPL